MHVQTAGFNRRSGAPVLGWARRFNSKGDVVTGGEGLSRPSVGRVRARRGQMGAAYRVTSAAAVRWGTAGRTSPGSVAVPPQGACRPRCSDDDETVLACSWPRARLGVGRAWQQTLGMCGGL